MNNQIGDMFQCWTCGGLFNSMWGETCNKCRQQQEQHKELLSIQKQQLQLDRERLEFEKSKLK